MSPAPQPPEKPSPHMLNDKESVVEFMAGKKMPLELALGCGILMALLDIRDSFRAAYGLEAPGAGEEEQPYPTNLMGPHDEKDGTLHKARWKGADGVEGTGYFLATGPQQVLTYLRREGFRVMEIVDGS